MLVFRDGQGDGDGGGGRSRNRDTWQLLQYLLEVGSIHLGDGVGIEIEGSKGDV